MKTFFLIALFFISNNVYANEFRYQFEPDIIAITGVHQEKVTYVRATMELILSDAKSLDEIRYHSPLLRSAILHILFDEEKRIKSQAGREQIRLEAEKKIKELMKSEIGMENDAIKTLSFQAMF